MSMTDMSWNICTFECSLRWKIAMKVSESLFVSSASGNSLKYCFTISATSYACWPSKLIVSPCISVISFSFWIRDRTPDLRNKPTWSRELTRNQRNAAWIHFGRAWPFLCKESSNGTPNTVLSGTHSYNIELKGEYEVFRRRCFKHWTIKYE